MMWLFLLTPLPLLAWVLIARREHFLAYARKHAGFGAIGGVISVISYGLVLWMMTIAPVAMVAALRETSILFAMAIAAVILHERMSIHRAIVVCVIAAGAMALRIT